MHRLKAFILPILTVAFFFPGAVRAHRKVHKRSDQPMPPISQSGYQLPVSNGSSSLPVPPSDDCLEFIALAIGTQEYSCTNSGGMTTPTHTGATATLYNVAPLVPFLPAEDYLHNLPAYFLHYNYGELKNSSLSVLGHHYYVDGVPTFDLGDSGLFQLEIYATIEAPQNPSENIGWVYGKSLDGTWTVYRVETAGGNSPPSCQETPFSVPYSAEYWLYKSG